MYYLYHYYVPELCYQLLILLPGTQVGCCGISRSFALARCAPRWCLQVQPTVATSTNATTVFQLERQLDNICDRKRNWDVISELELVNTRVHAQSGDGQERARQRDQEAAHHPPPLHAPAHQGRRGEGPPPEERGKTLLRPVHRPINSQGLQCVSCFLCQPCTLVFLVKLLGISVGGDFLY